MSLNDRNLKGSAACLRGWMGWAGPVVMSLWMAGVSQAQFNEADPLGDAYKVAASDEMFVLVAPVQGGEVTMRIVDVNGSVDDGFATGPTRTVGGFRDRAEFSDFSGQMDAAALDLDGDAKDDVVVVWEGSNREVILAIPDIRPGNMSIGAVPTYRMSDFGYPLLREPEHAWIPRAVQVIPAQLDMDAAAEFIVAWWAEGDGEADPVQIVAFELAADGTPVVIADLSDILLKGDPASSQTIVDYSGKFAIATGQFDDTFGEELIVAYGKQLGSEGDTDGWHLSARAYWLTGEGNNRTFTFAAEVSAPLYSESANGNYFIQRLAVTTGDFDGDALDEAAVGFTIAANNGSQATRMLVHYFEGDETLSSLTPMPGGAIFIEQTNGSSGFHMSVGTGDLNNDEFADLVYLSRRGLRVFTKWDGSTYVEDDHRLLLSNSFANDPQHSSSRIAALTDLDADADTSFEGEAVGMSMRRIEDNGSTVGVTVELGVSQLGDTFDIERIWTEDFTSGNFLPAIAMVTGDFDGDSLMLGRPTLYRRSEIVQPVMILNAPPIHYDVIDGAVFDINKCYYNDNPLINCAATATYTLQNTVVQEISTEVRADWAISTGITSSVEAEVAAVRAKLTASLDHRYGEGFSKTRRSSTTITETKQFIAEADDLIYATVSDYDVLEYPVFRDGESLGTIISVVPKEPRLITFNSKSPRASGYVSPHEPGNILSYRGEASAGSNPLVDRTVKEFQGFIWEMQPNGNSQWTLQLTEFTQDSLTHTVDQSISARAEVEFEVGTDIPIVDDIVGSLSSSVSAYVQGDYSTGSVNTHTTTLTVQHTLNVDFGNVDGAILGNTTYEVLPYIYWARNGALVLDYAVNPVLGDSFEGWWQQKYGHKPDLAFTLLSRHDQEKGLAVSDLETTRTNNIQVNPKSPRAGDVVDLFVRVHNYSIQPSNSPESVLRFYLGDPATGGTLLVNEDGESDVRVPPIAPRRYRVVALRNWRVPWQVSPNARLYAVIDPADVIDEIHEDNNVGWTPLNAQGGSLWPTSSDYGDGWKNSPWFGWFNDTSFPWILHLNMNYAYAASYSSPNSLFYYDRAIGAWCWTSPGVWPYVYFYSKLPGWNFYYETTVTPGRWYYSPSRGEFVHEPDIGG